MGIYYWDMTMPGDPRECRAQAVRYAELAAKAKTTHLRATFLGLSKHWEHVAADLEAMQAIVDELGRKSGNSRNRMEPLI